VTPERLDYYRAVVAAHAKAQRHDTKVLIEVSDLRDLLDCTANRQFVRIKAISAPCETFKCPANLVPTGF